MLRCAAMLRPGAAVRASRSWQRVAGLCYDARSVPTWEGMSFSTRGDGQNSHERERVERKKEQALEEDK